MELNLRNSQNFTAHVPVAVVHGAINTIILLSKLHAFNAKSLWMKAFVKCRNVKLHIDR